MERRTFCELTSLVVTSTFLPLMGCSGSDPSLYSKLSLPTTMAIINDSTTIIEVGIAYLKQVPGENDPESLADRLLIGSNGEVVPKTTDSLALQKIMSEKIQSDFDNGKIVVVRGWVLSRTEARQCALYSLTQPIN